MFVNNASKGVLRDRKRGCYPSKPAKECRHAAQKKREPCLKKVKKQLPMECRLDKQTVSLPAFLAQHSIAFNGLRLSIKRNGAIVRRTGKELATQPTRMSQMLEDHGEKCLKKVDVKNRLSMQQTHPTTFTHESIAHNVLWSSISVTSHACITNA